MNKKKPSFKIDELERIKALYSYQVLDSESEKEYDDLVLIASQICGTPTSLISLVDQNRQWHKAKVGLEADEIPRHLTFCTHAIQSDKTFIVEDASKDIRFKNNPLVTGNPNIRFYAGAQLQTSDGYNIGALCVIDNKPLKLSESQIQSLEALARQVVGLLELRKSLKTEKELVQKLADSSNLIDSLFQTCPLMMGIIELQNDEFVNISKNPAWIQFFDLNKTDLCEKLWVEKCQKSQNELKPIYFDASIDAKVGTIHLSSVVNLISTQNSYPRFSVIIVDRTQEIKSLKILEADRAKMIQSSRLTTLGEMAGSIAHEINNPLAVIKASAQLLEIELGKTEILNSSKVGDALKRIDSTVSRISKIIKGLRAFARDGHADPMAPVNLHQLVTEALELCQSRFKSHGVEIEFETIENSLVHGRAVELAQVIINLLNNAYDAVSECSVKKVNIRIRSHGDDYSMTVEDSGPGVPVEIQEKIMDPFFTTKPLGQGTGLGLSISKGIVESHEGRIVFSRVNDRTLFTVFLPKQKQNKLTA
jgi:C4-dicarboxylate-specific signal transduction histidine kinase